MGTNTLNAGDVGRLTKASAAIIPADYVLLQRSTTGHLRRATIAQIGAGFQVLASTSNVTVGGVLSVTGVSTLAGGMNTIVENVTNISAITTTGVTAISNNGITTIGTTAVHNALVLSAPVVGGFKWLRATSTFAMTVTASAATIGSTKTTIVFGGTDQAVLLRGEGTTQWGVYATVPSTAGTTAIALIA